MVFTSNRVTGYHIARKIREMGGSISAVNVGSIGKNRGMGRNLRRPNMGWVFTASEAEELLRYIIDHPELQD